MIDVKWNDNAKSAVREFADYIGESDKGERYLEHIAQNKTVADTVGQESERWTHTFKGGACKVVVGEPDAHGDIVIMSKKGVYLTPSSSLVVPKFISKLEHDAIVKFAESSGEQIVTMKAEEYLAGREII